MRGFFPSFPFNILQKFLEQPGTEHGLHGGRSERLAPELHAPARTSEKNSFVWAWWWDMTVVARKNSVLWTSHCQGWAVPDFHKTRHAAPTCALLVRPLFFLNLFFFSPFFSIERMRKSQIVPLLKKRHTKKRSPNIRCHPPSLLQTACWIYIFFGVYFSPLFYFPPSVFNGVYNEWCGSMVVSNFEVYMWVRWMKFVRQPCIVQTWEDHVQMLFLKFEMIDWL